MQSLCRVGLGRRGARGVSICVGWAWGTGLGRRRAVAAAGQRCGLHLASFGLWYLSSLPMRFEASSHPSTQHCAMHVYTVVCGLAAVLRLLGLSIVLMMLMLLSLLFLLLLCCAVLCSRRPTLYLAG